jgi:menaquinone-dependent protoporphyrinogen oxidase
MRKIGIIYSTADGHTKNICEKLESIIVGQKLNVDLVSISDFNKNITDYDTIVIGASVRYGKHNASIIKFMIDNKSALQSIRTIFFSVNLVARKEDKNTPDTNPYLIKFLKTIGWTPEILDVFAGRLDYSMYTFFDRIMIRLIMKLTNGPTKTESAIEYTDWNRVQKLGEKICTIE